MNTGTRMKDFLADLDAGWAEVTGGADKVANTKVIMQQMSDAQKAIGKATACVAKIGGPAAVLDAYVLGNDILQACDGFMNASVVLALSLEPMAQLDILKAAAEQGIKEEESKANN